MLWCELFQVNHAASCHPRPACRNARATRYGAVFAAPRRRDRLLVAPGRLRTPSAPADLLAKTETSLSTAAVCA